MSDTGTQFAGIFIKTLWLIISNPLVLLILAAIIITMVIKIILYKKSTYYAETNSSFFKVLRDKGKYGEYLTYKRLSSLEKTGCRFLFNVYLPKDNNETSELDVVAICKEGIFVFESKNYSGWIFGSEEQKSWTQVLAKGKGKSQKEHFYNPIFQNRTHIKYLKKIIGEEMPTYSVVVFSERCTFKKLEISGNVPVIKRDRVLSTVKNIIVNASDNNIDVDEIYDKLKPYTNVSDEIKQKHIEDINSKKST